MYENEMQWFPPLNRMFKALYKRYEHVRGNLPDYVYTSYEDVGSPRVEMESNLDTRNFIQCRYGIVEAQVTQLGDELVRYVTTNCEYEISGPMHEIILEIIKIDTSTSFIDPDFNIKRITKKISNPVFLKSDAHPDLYEYIQLDRNTSILLGQDVIKSKGDLIISVNKDGQPVTTADQYNAATHNKQYKQFINNIPLKNFVGYDDCYDMQIHIIISNNDTQIIKYINQLSMTAQKITCTQRALIDDVNLKKFLHNLQAMIVPLSNNNVQIQFIARDDIRAEINRALLQNAYNAVVLTNQIRWQNADIPAQYIRQIMQLDYTWYTNIINGNKLTKYNKFITRMEEYSIDATPAKVLLDHPNALVLSNRHTSLYIIHDNEHISEIRYVMGKYNDFYYLNSMVQFGDVTIFHYIAHHTSIVLTTTMKDNNMALMASLKYQHVDSLLALNPTYADTIASKQEHAMSENNLLQFKLNTN